MGILNKLMFWKKEDDLDFDKDFDKLADKEMEQPDLNMSLDEQQKQSLGLNEKSPFDQQAEEPSPFQQEPAPFPQQNQPAVQNPAPVTAQPGRELELIDSKLDTIKALLTSMDQRLANVEKSSGIEKKEKLW
jgi:hypothetical protein